MNNIYIYNKKYNIIMKVLYFKFNIRGNGVYRIILFISYSNYNIEDSINI